MAKRDPETRRYPKGVRLIIRLVVTRRCGHYEQLPLAPSSWPDRRLIRLTETECENCRE